MSRGIIALAAFCVSKYASLSVIKDIRGRYALENGYKGLEKEAVSVREIFLYRRTRGAESSCFLRRRLATSPAPLYVSQSLCLQHLASLFKVIRPLDENTLLPPCLRPLLRFR